MNPEVKQKWIKALRSGEYKQAKGQLTTLTGEDCCLGVLCKLAVAEGVIAPSTKEEKYVTYDRETHILPQKVIIWAGVDSCGGYKNENGIQWLTEDNDGGATFLDIADTIEKYL